MSANHVLRRLLAALSLSLLATTGLASPQHLVISRQLVTIDGRQAEKIALNQQIPGPVLRFREGETAEITVTNQLDVPTSVHWHGLILPGAMDGVPGLNGFHGIPPGQSFTYRFPLRQSGTYWYHAHSQLQEQDGLYGALVVEPRVPAEAADRDYVLLLSEFHPDSADTILHKLKSIPGYYNQGRRTLTGLFAQAGREGWRSTLADRLAWGRMRMDPTDLADVTGYSFLVNGQPPADAWTGLFRPGERVRLRVINASAMSFFDFRIPGLGLQVVSADGREVDPVSVDEFRIAPAETYDVIVRPAEAAAYTVVAEAIDRSGLALATLATSPGLRGPAPALRTRTELTMADMGMAHADMHEMHHHPGMTMDMPMPKPARGGWADAGTPTGHRALRYEDLVSRNPQPDTRKPAREIVIRLTGNMERYAWTLDGQPMAALPPWRLNAGERVRLTYANETMMAHPMHLHGMFVQLENGQPPERQPDKHTVIVPPGQRVSVLLSATEAGEWALHCHLLYHMASGMMGQVVVARAVPDRAAPSSGPQPVPAPADMSMEAHHHGHH